MLKAEEQQQPASQSVNLIPQAKQQQEEETTEKLLDELQKSADYLVARQKRMWIPYGVIMAGYIALIVALLETVTALTNSNQVSMTPVYLTPVVILLSTALLAAWYVWLGRSNRSRRRKQSETIRALAERQEGRAIAPLLPLMSNEAFWKHKETRSAFIDAMKTLLPKLTPEQFQALSAQEVKLLVGQMGVAGGGLNQVAEQTLVRCGDDRAVKALEGTIKLTQTVNVMNRYNPGAYLMMPRIEKMIRNRDLLPGNDPELQGAFLRCRDGMRARIDVENKGAQLLRGSSSEATDLAGTLLRGVMPGGATTDEHELLRADACATEEQETEKQGLEKNV